MTGEVATLADLAEVVDGWGEAVLVLVAGAEGSTPREAGAAMLVGRTGLRGTIGGGRAEHEAVEVARALFAGPERRRGVTVALGPASDQCCGGRLRLAFARLGPDDLARGSDGRLVLWPGGPVFVGRAPGRQVNLHGAGHVGRALALALAPLPFRLRWIDSRLDGFSGAAVPAGCETLTMPIPEAAVARAEPGAFHVVLTHSHAADLEIVDAVLRRGAFGFLGLIGSGSKRALFRRRLAERGHGEAALARLTCPIGFSGIDDKRPAVIAASVAAQLLEVEQRLAAAEVRAESPA
ncbi:MAG TPA: xanthine dehydrogenase accessory protein XdhC [Thermohalobaculum sp.]|nr:xanthine dehydrogenase accessory protein XdhC [Thermohalobaculum sp.]